MCISKVEVLHEVLETVIEPSRNLLDYPVWYTAFVRDNLGHLSTREVACPRLFTRKSALLDLPPYQGTEHQPSIVDGNIRK